MRQGQQNRRGRGRPSNHNRSGGGKGQNPLSRSYESNGPDVKIRGNPAHIAEKYISLARDSLSSGDIVMAENYLQHAEHYNRIIMTYREQTQSQNDRANTNGQQPRHSPQNQTVQSLDDDPDAIGQDDTMSSDANGSTRAPVQRGRPRPQPRQQREPEPRETETRGRRPAQRAPRARPPRDHDSDTGSGEQPRPQSRQRPAAKEGDGSKITDGQDTPGFLRKPAAPAKRRRKAPDTESVTAKDEA